MKNQDSKAWRSVLHVAVSIEMYGYLQNAAQNLSSKFSAICCSPAVLFTEKYLDYHRFLIFNFHSCMQANEGSLPCVQIIQLIRSLKCHEVASLHKWFSPGLRPPARTFHTWDHKNKPTSWAFYFKQANQMSETPPNEPEGKQEEVYQLCVFWEQDVWKRFV